MHLNRWKVVLFSLVPAVILLLGTEILLRVVYYQREGDSTLALWELLFDHRTEDTDRYIRLREWPPNLDLILSPVEEELRHSDALESMSYRLRTDANGFIKPSFVHEEADLCIFFLGGSTTECRYVGETNRFPYLSGALLSTATGKRVNAINAAKSGNNSMHSINVLINKIIPFKPDVVVMMHNINDWILWLHEGSYWNDNPSRSLIAEPHFEKTQMTSEWSPGLVACDTAEMRLAFTRAQHLFVDICERYGIEPVLMCQLTRFRKPLQRGIAEGTAAAAERIGLSYDDYCDLQARCNDVIRNVGKSRNILVIDLDQTLPATNETLYDVMHYHDKGSIAAAHVVAGEMLKYYQWN